MISVDGTGGSCRDLSAAVIIGCHSVKLRTECDRVTSSLHPIAHLNSGGETLCPVLLAMCELRRLCWILFRVDLILDWGESDHAAAFMGAHQTFTNWSTALDFMCKLAAKEEDIIVPTDAVPSSTPIACPSQDKPVVATQLSQDVSVVQHTSENSRQKCGLFCEQARKKVRTCTCPMNHSILQCSFHAVQCLVCKPSTSHAGKLRIDRWFGWSAISDPKRFFKWVKHASMRC